MRIILSLIALCLLAACSNGPDFTALTPIKENSAPGDTVKKGYGQDNSHSPPLGIAATLSTRYQMRQSALYFKTKPRMLAIKGFYQAAKTCDAHCTLDDISVIDTSTDQKLQPIRDADAVNIMYPPPNLPQQHFSYGNGRNSQQNNAVVMNNSVVGQKNMENKTRLLNTIIGNLHFGPLDPHKPSVGTIFFTLPDSSRGPYAVTTKFAGEEDTLRFDALPDGK